MTDHIQRLVKWSALALLLAVSCFGWSIGAQPARADGGDEPSDSILVPRNWSLIPRGIPAGGEFRLLVVTKLMRDSSSTEIADYDAHVQADLAASNAHPGIAQYASLFRVVGSTTTVAARDHIEAGPEHEPGVAIYWLNGARVSESYRGFFSGKWQSYDASWNNGRTVPGDRLYGFYIATGSTNAGGRSFGEELGTRRQHFGRDSVAYGVLQAGGVFDYSLEADTVAPEASRPFYAISPVFRVMDDGTPHTVSVTITSDAGSDNDYGRGDTIRAKVTFNEAVTVSGQPILQLRFGRDEDHKAPYASEVVDAAYVASASTATELVFDYTVSADETDDDGLSIGRGAIRLNGGSITKQNASTKANVYNRLLKDQPEHRVNQAPFARRPQILSRPLSSSDEYGLGELIQFVIPFSESVEVNTAPGRPQLNIQIGRLKVKADFLYTNGSKVIFGHVVADRQIDVNGVRVKKNGLKLNGSTIRSVETGRDARFTFGWIDFSGHGVDAGLTPPASSNARLASFSLSGVSLRPAFDPDVTEYMGTAPNGVSETTLRSLAYDSAASVTFSHADADSDASGRQISLPVGDTTITLTVAASDQRSTKTYTIKVMRSMAGNLAAVSIVADEDSVVEGTATSFTLTRSAPLAGALTVALDVSQTGVVVATDGTYAPPTEITFTAGSATATLSVRTQSDTTDEPDGTIKAMLMPKIHYNLGEADSAQVTVSDDDDTPTATLQLSSASIGENGGVSTVTATLDRASSEGTTIALSATPVAPAAAADFSLSPNAELSIPAGETTSVGTVTITAQDNAVGNASKTVTVSARTTNAHSLNPPDALTLTITDDESSPTAPMHLTATPGDAQVTLSWDAPAAAADVTRHEYRHHEVGSQYANSWTEIPDSAPGETNEDGVTVSGLTNAASYNFQVRAVSDAGVSESSMDASAFVGAGQGICDRTDQVRTRLLSLLGNVSEIEDVSDCADVTAAHLAKITGEVKIVGSDLDSLKAGDFDGLTKVTQLLLYKQNITFLPDGLFSDMASLELLDLHVNHLATVSAPIFTGLTALEELDLSFNELYEVEDSTFAELTSLQTLKLFYNHLPRIRVQMFDGLTNLTELDVSRNWIATIEADSFEDLSSVTKLHLDFNQIVHWYPNMLAGLESIKRLRLDSNPFKEATVHSPFVDLSTLEYLNVDFGQLRFKFAPGMFKGLTSLETLAAMGNWREGNVLPLYMRLEMDTDHTIRVEIPAGAPFDVVAEVKVQNGSLADGATAITVNRGETKSDSVAVTRTTGTTGPVRVRFGELPSIPAGDPEADIGAHVGYGLSDSAGNPLLEVIPALPTLKLALSPSGVLEQDDTATSGVTESMTTVTATLKEPIGTPFSVTVSVAAVSPATDDAVTLSSNTTLSFAANSTTSTGTVTITAVDNDTATGDRHFTVSGTTSAAVAHGPDGVTLTVHDDEPPVAPSDLSASAGDREVILMWAAPNANHGVESFEYRYRASTETDYPETWTAVGGGYLGERQPIPALVDPHPSLLSPRSSSRAAGYRVRNLTNDVAHLFQVRAVNMAGTSGAPATSDAATPSEWPQVELVLSPAKIGEQDDSSTLLVDESVSIVSATLTEAVSVPFTVTVTAADSQSYSFGPNRVLSVAADSTASTGTVSMSAVYSTVAEPDAMITVSGAVSSTGRRAGVQTPQAVTLTIMDADNSPPTSEDATVRTDEDTAYTFQASDFPFFDGNIDDALQSVGILKLPQRGTLKFGEVTLSDGYKVDAANIGQLSFEPAPHEYGSKYTSFAFNVNDGEASSVLASTMTIAVTSVNDRPVFDSEAAPSAVEGQTLAGYVVASDADQGDAVQYAISGGADSALFAIDANSGQLTFATAPDFDNPSDSASTDPANAAENNEYVVVVTATGGSGDAALTANQTIIVTVTEAMETVRAERVISSVSLTSAPGSDQFYGIDDLVTLQVAFDGAVSVDPTPRASVGLSRTNNNGNTTTVDAGSACYVSGSGSSTLLFRFAIREGQGGQLVVQSLTSNEGEMSVTGSIYAGDRDNPANLAFTATTPGSGQAADGIRPQLRSSRLSADRTSIILVLSEDLSATTAPLSAFTVTVAGEAATVSSVTASSTEVTLSLAAAVAAGARVELAYSEPTPVDQLPPSDRICGLDFAGNNANAIQDLVGNDARGFSSVVEAGTMPDLTASLVDVPIEHDGDSPFSFRLSFSEPIATSFVWIRDGAFSVANGDVTAVHRVQGRSDLWNITVEPSNRDDISLTLTVPASCSNLKRAVCTSDKRGLSAAVSASMPGPPGEPPALTAEFLDVPPEHDGANQFSVQLQFNDPISISFSTLQTKSLSAGNGSVSAVRRVDGRNDLWEVDITPNRYQDVTVALSADEGCGGDNAVCTSDARALTNSPSFRVRSRPEPWFAISDTEVHEGPNVAASFEVTLSHAAPIPVTVDYATASGRATEGVDFEATSGTLTFAVGEVTKTITVNIFDDSVPEVIHGGPEAFQLRISNADGASIPSGVYGVAKIWD